MPGMTTARWSIAAAPGRAGERCDVGGDGLCTHGPDPAPPGVDPAVPDVPADFQAASFAICDGNGVSGNRVQVMYVHASDKPDRYAEFVDSFRGWAAEGDAVYQNSAAETGGMRYIRFVHDADCRITVLNVTVSPTGDDDFWSLTSELKWTKGFTDPNRKYLVFLDSNHPDYLRPGRRVPTIPARARATRTTRPTASPSSTTGAGRAMSRSRTSWATTSAPCSGIRRTRAYGITASMSGT